METTIVEWLSAIGRAAFVWSLGFFLIVNGIAAVAYFARRDRAMVNKWTSRVLAVDLLLLGTGVGVPMMTTMAGMTVRAATAAFGSSAPAAVAPAAGAIDLDVDR